jgi:hypothetical protein
MVCLTVAIAPQDSPDSPSEESDEADEAEEMRGPDKELDPRRPDTPELSFPDSSALGIASSIVVEPVIQDLPALFHEEPLQEELLHVNELMELPLEMPDVADRFVELVHLDLETLHKNHVISSLMDQSIVSLEGSLGNCVIRFIFWMSTFR